MIFTWTGPDGLTFVDEAKIAGILPVGPGRYEIRLYCDPRPILIPETDAFNLMGEMMEHDRQRRAKDYDRQRRAKK